MQEGHFAAFSRSWSWSWCSSGSATRRGDIKLFQLIIPSTAATEPERLIASSSRAGYRRQSRRWRPKATTTETLSRLLNVSERPAYRWRQPFLSFPFSPSETVSRGNGKAKGSSVALYLCISGSQRARQSSAWARTCAACLMDPCNLIKLRVTLQSPSSRRRRRRK